MTEETLKGYLESEIASAKKSVILSAILFALIGVLVVGYFHWFKAEVEPFLEPAELAEFTVSEARRNLPAVVDRAGKSLNAALPLMIRDAMEGVLDTTIPMLRLESEKWMRSQARGIAAVGTGAVATAFEEIVVAKRAELLKHSGSDPAQYFPAVRLDELSNFVSKEASKEYNSVPEETLGQKLEKGASALRNINHSLKTLAEGENFSRKDVLGKRLISVWWTMLKQLDDGETATEKAMGLKVKSAEDLRP